MKASSSYAKPYSRPRWSRKLGYVPKNVSTSRSIPGRSVVANVSSRSPLIAEKPNAGSPKLQPPL